MTIEQSSHRIHQRILLVVPFHQHGVEPRDAAGAKIPGALDQPRQERKHRRRVALRRRRFPGGQADLALSHRKPRERIDHQQHMLRRSCRNIRPPRSPLAPRECAREAIGPMWTPPRTERLHSLFSECVFDEVPHFAAAFPTSASTVTPAEVPRAIMPIRVLLPTPLPPKIPTRWPRPQVRNTVDGADSAADRHRESVCAPAEAEHWQSEAKAGAHGTVLLESRESLLRRSPGPASTGPTEMNGRVPRLTMRSP